MNWRKRASKPIITKEMKKMDTKEEDLWNYINLKNKQSDDDSD